MGKLKDLTGQRFGRLVVTKFAGYKKTNNGRNKAIWTCNCDCGNEKDILGNDLTSGRTTSCGCYQKENLKKLNTFSRNYKNIMQGNEYDLSGEYGIGYTSKGEEFYFDLEDYDKIKNYTWHIDNYGYVKSHSHRKRTLLHRLVLDVNDTEIKIDHIKHNKRDNRKSKLRIVTDSQNCINQSLRINNTSGVTGVCWSKKNSKWRAYICKEGKRVVLGSFTDFDEAVKVRKEAEEKYFGEYSYDNSMNL